MILVCNFAKFYFSSFTFYKLIFFFFFEELENFVKKLLLTRFLKTRLYCVNDDEILSDENKSKSVEENFCREKKYLQNISVSATFHFLRVCYTNTTTTVYLSVVYRHYDTDKYVRQRPKRDCAVLVKLMIRDNIGISYHQHNSCCVLHLLLLW